MNWHLATFPSLKRRGGCGINKKMRSNQRAADGVVSSAKAFRPNDFAGLTTPSARTKVASRYFLTAHPPLLFKEYPELSCVQPNNSKKQAPEANEGLTGAVS